MNLLQTISTLKNIASLQPNVRKVDSGDVYDIMNGNGSIEYPCVVISQNNHSEDERMWHFSFTLFYIDRLLDNLDSNMVEIQSIGQEVISNILRQFSDYADVDFPTNVRYTPFTQKFVDLTAGMYAQFTLDTFKDNRCPDGMIGSSC